MPRNGSPVPVAAKLMVATDRDECQKLKDRIVMEDITTMVVATASSSEAFAAATALKNGEERRSSSIGAMDAKVLIATSPGDHELLKDTLNKGDAAAMLLVMASIKEDTGKYSKSSAMNPLLLSLASQGDCCGLNEYIRKMEQEATAATITFPNGNGSNNTVATQQAGSGAGAELGMDLEGVTPEGNTALHVLATCGDGLGFWRSAGVIYSRSQHLMLVQNNNGDTPLHCAVRAGHSEMVSYLIDLVETEDNSTNSARLEELLRKENCRKETAFHDAVRIGNKDIITNLFNYYSELPGFLMDATGTSPLYLAVLLQRAGIAKLLHQMTDGNLSYSGPNRQNALHAAVLQDQVMTKMLLEWNKGLAEQSDENGSTPLHFAASLLVRAGIKYNTVIPVLRANPVQLYKPDSEGLYPIHVAASSGANLTVRNFIRERLEIAGLRDSKGRTFLHVAVERGRWNVVSYACHNQSLARILSMQDNDGNTAMHIAVKHGNKAIFCSLLKNKENPDKLILWALKFCNARSGCRRVDHLQEQYILRKKQVDKVRESEKMTNSIQTLGIASVLIVTVTFGVIFAIPGGYIADEHDNSGTPTLAGSYMFDAFIMANTIAFICSSLATINLMYSGMPMPLNGFRVARALYVRKGNRNADYVLAMCDNLRSGSHLVDTWTQMTRKSHQMHRTRET
uniref:PGG domain-containing protein n=1 Tax=Oryza glumipatula TaxID=40148 RepID=A0A0E0B276_9ORYZ